MDPGSSWWHQINEAMDINWCTGRSTWTRGTASSVGSDEQWDRMSRESVESPSLIFKSCPNIILCSGMILLGQGFGSDDPLRSLLTWSILWFSSTTSADTWKQQSSTGFSIAQTENFMDLRMLIISIVFREAKLLQCPCELLLSPGLHHHLFKWENALESWNHRIVMVRKDLWDWG